MADGVRRGPDGLGTDETRGEVGSWNLGSSDPRASTAARRENMEPVEGPGLRLAVPSVLWLEVPRYLPTDVLLRRRLSFSGWGSLLYRSY